MSDATPFEFGKFVPGFDFLQSLGKGASGGIPQMPQLASWVAPTLNEEELEKRIEELKAVQFWLDQNSRALTATVQALEVQKMTLATLKGMNVHMADVANAFRTPSTASAAPPPPVSQPQATAQPQPAPAEPSGAAGEGSGAASGSSDDKANSQSAENASGSGPGIVDPMQWWGALTQQFQQIAASALKDAAAQTEPGSKAKHASARSATSKKSSAASASARKPVAKKAGAGRQSAAKKTVSGKAQPIRKRSA